MVKLTAEDKKWQAENDDRTLSEALEIQEDKGRLSQAAAAGKKLTAELAKRATTMAVKLRRQ